MTVNNITDSQKETYAINGAGNTYNFTSAVMLQVSGQFVDAIDVGNLADTTIFFNGFAFSAAGDGIWANSADRLQVTVGTSGVIFGGAGIWARGAQSVVVNNGQIVGRSYGVELDGTGSSLQNNETIRSGFQGVSIYGSGSHITNIAGAEIIGEYSGVSIFVVNNGTSRLANHGYIQGDTYALNFGFGNDRVFNDGVIKGRIDLGNGKDYFDTRGGKIDGDVSGGVGDDIFLTDNARYKLVEIDGQGEDITRSTVSYKLYSTSFVERLELVGNKNINGTGTSRGEELWGNAGDNSLSGMAGIDGLDGKAGNDRLNGGLDLDADRFIFKTGYDHDTIVNFRDGDRVFIGGWKAIENFADVRQHAHNEGNNVVIEAGNDSLTIIGLHKADLVAADFNFLL